jgi:hypothetical protein
VVREEEIGTKSGTERRNVFLLFCPGKRICEKSLDKRYTNMVISAMLARRVTRLDPLPTTLTPLVRYCCKLLVAPQNPNPFAIKQIQTLSSKCRGYGIRRSSWRTPRVGYPGTIVYELAKMSSFTSHRSRVTNRAFARPLFSYSYELLFPQALCFDNDPHCPGWRGVQHSSTKHEGASRVRAAPGQPGSFRKFVQTFAARMFNTYFSIAFANPSSSLLEVT